MSVSYFNYWLLYRLYRLNLLYLLYSRGSEVYLSCRCLYCLSNSRGGSGSCSSGLSLR